MEIIAHWLKSDVKFLSRGSSIEPHLLLVSLGLSARHIGREVAPSTRGIAKLKVEWASHNKRALSATLCMQKIFMAIALILESQRKWIFIPNTYYLVPGVSNMSKITETYYLPNVRFPSNIRYPV